MTMRCTVTAPARSSRCTPTCRSLVRRLPARWHLPWSTSFARTYSSSSYALTISTRTSGWSWMSWRVLMVSAYDEDEYVRGALEAGAAGYLSKTVPGKELVEAVRAVAGGATVLQSGLTARLLIASRQPEQGVTDLSERELEVLRLLAEGLHNREIGVLMGISTRTVDRHCDNIYAKLGVSTRTEAVVRAISTKLLTVSDEH